MIANGIDIVGYDWVKFVKSDNIHHEVDGKDIILYGNTSNDFSYLFDIVSSVEINDSEYIDVSPAVISKIGSVSVQSNTVDQVLLNIILTDTEETKVLVSNNNVVIICNVNDKSSINLGSVSDKIKILNLAKEYGTSLGNIRNARITKNDKILQPYYNNEVYPLNNVFYTNVSYTRALNRLNAEILSKLPKGFDFVIGKRDHTNSKPNTVYCDYTQMEIEHKHFFRELRRNIMHVLPVNYEFRVTDDIKYAKLHYEMSNYDFITNICELTVNDDENKPWVFAIHWTVEPFEVDNQDPKTGNDTVGRSIKCVANLHLFTSIDNYVADITKVKDDIIEIIKANYQPCNEIAIITKDQIIMD